MRSLYTLLLRAVLPLILLRLWWRGRREPGYREAIEERFGAYEHELDAGGNLVWVHAVSVGEVRAAAPLVRALARALPDHLLLVTCTTAAGRDTVKQVYGESVLSAYVPYDYPEAVQAFLEHFRPRLGVLMETEVWPNLLEGCAANGVPIVLANARMSEKSARGYARLPALTAPAFQSIDAVCAQSAADAERLRALGAREPQITGNLKFDVQPDPAQIAAGRAWRERLGRPVLLFASTREGEEKILLEAWRRRQGDLAGNALVLIVPRHPQRFDEVAALADARRTRDELPAAEQKVYLGDTMGEMAYYYAACDVAVIGGSFAPLGGQNLIEALAVGAPVVVGPSTFNFAEATRLATGAGAAIQVTSATSALARAMLLLSRPEERAAMALAGKKLCEAHRGATERHLQVCLGLLKA